MGNLYQRYLYHNYRATSGMWHWWRRRISPAGWVVLVSVMVLAMRVDTTLSIGYQAFALFACLLLIALVASRFSRARLGAWRVLPRLGSVGTDTPYRVVIENKTNRIQRGLIYHEELADPRPSLEDFRTARAPGEAQFNWLNRLYRSSRWRWLMQRNQHATVKDYPIPPLPPRGRVEINTELQPRRRGVVRLAALNLCCPDPFGLFRSLVRIPSAQSLLILPQRYPLPPLALPGTVRHQPGGIAMASSVGECEEFVALRDYRPGDPLRRIHWKSWAKTGKPIVKEFEDEFFVRHALILDTFAECDGTPVFEEAVSVAASFACTVQTQESLLDLLFVGTRAFCFTMGRGLAHLEQMLEVLASVSACPDKPFATLHQLVADHSPLLSGCVCIFQRWDEERQKLAGQLKALGVPMLVLVIVANAEDQNLDPGPLRDTTGVFHPLVAGHIAEGLQRL